MSKKTRLDLSGKYFGRWKILHKDPVRTAHRAVKWVCECSCGTIKSVESKTLVNKTSLSCGCLQKELASEHQQLKKPNESGFNSLCYNYQKRAKKRQVNFDLTKDELKVLFSSNCHYCNRKPLNISTVSGYQTVKAKERSCFLYNGLDRVNNNEGYTIENVVPCCADCNFSKGKKSYEEFIHWLKRAYEYYFSRRL